MDLEREDSAHESVADNEGVGGNGNSDSNGSVSIDRERFGEEGGDKEVVDSTNLGVQESAGLGEGEVKKGRGLRKWRRIKRDVTKEGCVVVDGSMLSKRGFSNGGGGQGKPVQFSSEMRQSSEGSVSSTQAMMWRLGGSMDGFAAGDSGPEVGPFFATAAESENSDDPSSKSSTAASVPNMGYGGPVSAGFVKDRNKIANVNGKNLGSSVKKVSQGKAQTEINKKARGEQVNIEKETSHSSVESDSRSSNFIFMQDSRHVTKNGKQNGGSVNYGGENSPETLGNSRQVTEQLRSGSGKNSDGESEDISQEDLNAASSSSVKKENSENQGFSTDQDDPTIEAIRMLQSAQEAFEKEIQKIMEIGTEDCIDDDSNQDSCQPSELMSDGLEANGSGGDDSPHSLHSLEAEVNSLKENLNLMETKLEETTTMLKMKEAKIGELEYRLFSDTDGKEMGKAHIVNLQDLKSEVEALYKQKIETDIEYLTITKTIQDLRVASVDQISQLEEKVVSEQSQIMNKLIDAELKAVNLKRDAQKLEKHCEDVVTADKIVKLQSSICKYTTCFLIQMVLMLVMLVVFISKLSPRSIRVVPT